MNTRKHNWILYLISITITVTIAVQFYWNYKNFQENRRRVINEIQISFDNAVEEYFSNNTIKPKYVFGTTRKNVSGKNDSETISHINISSGNLSFTDTDSIRKKILPDINKLTLGIKDTIPNNKNTIGFFTDKSVRGAYTVFKTKDSLNLSKIRNILVAVSNDSINFVSLDSLFRNQLNSKGINTSYYFNYLNRDSIQKTSGNSKQEKFTLFRSAKSTFLTRDKKLVAFHSDPTANALKKSSTGILISLLLSLTIVGSLFYLLKIINTQKELAEVKNDLISNITHEFKTPIATISTAIEAIENFNVINDQEKTQKYLSMSSVQLKKLHQMVEKLLETATLDSENLMLKKENIDLIELTERITLKHQVLTNKKKIIFTSNVPNLRIHVDLFHFENAISNLIDNSIKYGGNKIEVNVNSVLNHTEISIADNGNGIDKNQQEKIFDKFYRIPKGNTHDVKGFGIGLYYSKKIIEKHGGTIQLISNAQTTVFKIGIPNE